MFHCQRLRALLFLNNIPQTPKCYYLLLQPFSTTSDSDQNSFTISYLINTCGLSPQDALNASKRLRFNTPHKPDSVISFFKNYGFSNTQLQTIIRREPELFVSIPIKTILPKFQFLSSKGASNSGIIAAVTRSPRFLRVSLENHIIPIFDLVRSFYPSDQKAITLIIAFPISITDVRMKRNVNYLLDSGVKPSSIYNLLSNRISTICANDLRNVVDEIKGLGFDPKKHNFCIALLAKGGLAKSQWDAKVDVLKRWGLSQDEIFNAFTKNPKFMLRSTDKLNAVMSFWIKQLGWDPLVLVASPAIFGYSLEKRLIPRASVIRYLLSKGLIKKGVSLYTPFGYSDELFMKRYVNCFEDEASRLLKLYQGGC